MSILPGNCRYPQVQLLSADEKRYVDLVDVNVLTAQIYYNSAITVYVNDILQVLTLVLE